MSATTLERAPIVSPDTLTGDESLWTERFDLLPREAIKNITINPRLADATDPRILAWLDPETIYRHAIFSIGTDTGDVTTINSPSAHRSTILERDIEDPFFIHGLPYNEISAKGTGMTKQHLYMLPKVITEPFAVPGFLPLNIAQENMEKLNDFAEAGGRGGLSLAIAELDPVVLREWLQSHLGYKPTISPRQRNEVYDAIWWLNLMETYNKKPAIEFRVKANSNYMDAVRFDPDTGKSLEDGHMYSKETILQRSAKLIAKEIEHRGYDEFARHYQLGNLSVENKPKEYNYSDQDKTPDMDQITYETMVNALVTAIYSNDGVILKKAVFPFELYLHGWNLGVKERLAKERGEFKTNFSQQNADSAGFVYDMGGLEHTPDVGTDQLFKFHMHSRDGDHKWEYELHEAGYKAGFEPTIVEFPVPANQTKHELENVAFAAD